ncbi:hypothetical protein [Streptomyces flavidovirens]|uniref:hypothetical protein n=1 Tax=Streptomyces flavidovirens TaxID=67298 RepID=UPI0036751EC4
MVGRAWAMALTRCAGSSVRRSPAFTAAGLDLTRTSPPVPEILDDIHRSRDGLPCYIAIKTNDQIAYDSLNRSFTNATHLRTITPKPPLPYGANMDFHLYRLGQR